MTDRRKELYKRFIEQKILGLILIIIAVVIIAMCNNAPTVEQADCAGAVMAGALGLYMVLTRHVVV